MKYLLTTTALGLLLAVTPAAAQDKPADQPAQSQTQQPGTTTPTPAPGAQPDAMQKPDTAQKQDMEKPGGQAGAGQMQYVQAQEEGDWLATDLIGQSVVNANNESIGDINDLLFDESGKVNAAVIGVGGFLGIGEKKVAVGFDSLQMSKDENDNMQVSLNITRESLELAPEFVSLEDKQAEQDRASRQTQGGGGNPMGGGTSR